MHIRMSPRTNRKAPIVYNPGDENAFGENNQPNEMGADLFKDKHQRELVALFDEVLKPGGWRMDQRPPPNTCANYTFVPASLASIDRIDLYKHGIAGRHYAVEWAGLKIMVAKYGGKDYAPVFSLDTSARGEDGTAVAYPPVVEEAEEAHDPLIGTIISPSIGVAAAVAARRPQLSLQDLYAHKRLLEDDLVHLEALLLEDDVCSAHKRVRVEVELAEQETNYSLVKQAILEGYVPIAVTHDL